MKGSGKKKIVNGGIPNAKGCHFIALLLYMYIHLVLYALSAYGDSVPCSVLPHLQSLITCFYNS